MNARAYRFPSDRRPGSVWRPAISRVSSPMRERGRETAARAIHGGGLGRRRPPSGLAYRYTSGDAPRLFFDTSIPSGIVDGIVPPKDLAVLRVSAPLPKWLRF